MPAPDHVPVLPPVEQLFDQFPAGLIVTSHTGTILKVNQTFCNWVGLARDELVGKKRLQELFTMGGRIFHQTHWLPMLEMQGSLSEVKLDVRHKGGHTIPMMLNAIRRAGEAGNHDEISMTMAEERNKYERELVAQRMRAGDLVTKEREAQAALQITQTRLRQALRLGNLYLWDVDAATGARRYEDDVALLLGHPAPRAVDDALFAAAVAPEDREGELQAMRRALTAPDQGYSRVYDLLGADGVRRTVASTGQGVFDEGGRLTYFVGVLIDITESTRERARTQDRALFAEQMVGIVSHDLRNPLSAILMGTRLLAHGEIAPRKLRVLERVESSARRAQRLIEDLLDFTLVRVGRGLSVERASVDLHALVASIVDELALAFPDRAIVHRAEGEGTCTADADRIAQILGNLVGNAMAYGDPGSSVTVTSSLQPDTASLCVHNQGEPIPPDLQASVFEPMVRGDVQQSAGRSVGLGLFIVRAIARAHGGDVQLTSSRQAGTSFTFVFPRA